MFDIGYSELLLIAAVALVVIGPKDLPRVMRVVGHWVGRARGMARHFRSGIDEMIRQSELDELEKRWRDENDRIMKAHPLSGEFETVEALPAPAAGDDAGTEAEPPQDELPLPPPPPRELP
jgi:sec-independent protein translocase protein TatB